MIDNVKNPLGMDEERKSMTYRVKCLSAALGIFLAEILIATKLTAFRFIRGSLGDFLVVILLFFALKTIRDFETRVLAVSVFLFSCLVETAQYLHIADRLGFARGSIPHIVLGNSFSMEDILMYGLGCISAAWLDGMIRPVSKPMA